MAEQVKKDPGKGAERLANALAGVIERESQRQEVLQQQLQQQAMIEAQRTFEMQKQSMQQNFMQVLEEQKNKFAERIHREEMALRRNQQAQNQLNADREFGLSERQFQELQNRNKLEAERLASIKKTAEMDFLLKTANSLNDGIQSALGNPEYQNHLIGIQQGIYNMLSKRYGLQPPAPAPPPGAQTDATEQPAASPGGESGGGILEFFGFGKPKVLRDSGVSFDASKIPKIKDGKIVDGGQETVSEPNNPGLIDYFLEQFPAVRKGFQQTGVLK